MQSDERKEQIDQGITAFADAFENDNQVHAALAALGLLNGFLKDINRIATALEGIEMNTRKNS